MSQEISVEFLYGVLVPQKEITQFTKKKDAPLSPRKIKNLNVQRGFLGKRFEPSDLSKLNAEIDSLAKGRKSKFAKERDAISLLFPEAKFILIPRFY